MTKDEFKKQALAAMAKYGATKAEAFTDRPYDSIVQEGQLLAAKTETIFGASCTYRGNRYEMSMVHGAHDEQMMGQVIRAIERLPADVAEASKRPNG